MSSSRFRAFCGNRREVGTLMADRETMDAYAERAEDYANRFGSDTPGAHMQRFIAAIPEGGRVLDLGCGPGQSSAFMREAGLSVTSWDASVAMAEIGRKRFGLDTQVKEFSDLQETEIYDGIYANFSLLHAPKSEMPDHLARISKAMKPGGVLHLGLKAGDGEKRDRFGRFYAFYQDAEITGLLADAGLTVKTRDFGEEAGLEGTVDPWIILTARKAAS